MSDHIWATELGQQANPIYDARKFNGKWLEPDLYAYMPLKYPEMWYLSANDQLTRAQQLNSLAKHLIPKFGFS